MYSHMQFTAQHGFHLYKCKILGIATRHAYRLSAQSPRLTQPVILKLPTEIPRLWNPSKVRDPAQLR